MGAAVVFVARGAVGDVHHVGAGEAGQARPEADDFVVLVREDEERFGHGERPGFGRGCLGEHLVRGHGGCVLLSRSV